MSGASVEDREVTWKVLDIPVTGTITAPRDAKASSAVVLLAGSGPTDRNWCSPLLPGPNGTGRLLAEALAERGFVTLRYDKLGSGPRAKEYVPRLAGKVTMRSFVDELSGGIEALLSEYGGARDSLFALGNSEGTIHAVNYQLQAKGNRFKGLVLTGPPGRSVGDVARSQLLSQLEYLHHAKGATGMIIGVVSRLKPLPDTETTMRHYDEAASDFLAGKPMNPDRSLPKGIKKLLLSLETPTNLPFSRELWAYSLPEHISSLTEPALMVIGKKDIQVDWREDGKRLEAAMEGRTGATFAYPDDANHLLKHESKPREELNTRYVGKHYNSPKATLDGEAADVIFGWLQDHART